jgi:hypothetical protein
MKADENGIRRTRGVPTPELKCLEGLRQLSALVEANTDESILFFHAGFVPVLDAVLNKLIEWTEDAVGDLGDWAGPALAERLRFLSAQEEFWCTKNTAFCQTRKRFGDRRSARTPREYLGWLTDDYVRAIHGRRPFAALLLDPGFTGSKESVADVCQYSEEKKQWLGKVGRLDDLSPESADEWVAVVFQRMSENEDDILAELKMRGHRLYRSREYRENSQERGKMRLSDLYPTIAKAVHALASKPRGQVRGVTKP